MSFIVHCKGQNAFGNACTSGANLKNLFLSLAPVVQTEKTTFCLLHHRCKRKKLLLGRCTGGANRKNHFLALAPPVQAFPKTFWPSCDSLRNSLLALFLHRAHVKGQSKLCDGKDGTERWNRPRISSTEKVVLCQLWRAGKHSPYIFGTVFNE